MTDKYAVIGNPIAHTKSPQIHEAFAKQTDQDISYKAILAPLDGFEITVRRLIDENYKGVNVTVPFKLQAFLLSDSLSPFAKVARAANTLILNRKNIQGHNTDGVGLVNDITQNLGTSLQGKRVLLLGAGGAAFGVLQTLAEANPSLIIISNRTFAKAEEAAEILSRLIDTSQSRTVCMAKRFDELGDMERAGIGDYPRRQKFDLVINSTSTGLADAALPIPNSIFAEGCLAYDMMYGRETPFMAQAKAAGAQVADGLGMLVEQAAEAFYIWRGVRPETAPVIAMLRQK
jgi:shikimate dehydrogenase